MAGDGRDCEFSPWAGRSPAEGNGNPLQYSCLENPINRGAWWAALHGACKGSDTSERVDMHTQAPSLPGVSGRSQEVTRAGQRGNQQCPGSPCSLPSFLPSPPFSSFWRLLPVLLLLFSSLSLSPSKPHLWCLRLSLQEAIKNLQGSLSERISSDPVTSRWTLTPPGREHRPCRNQQKLPTGPVPCFLESPLFKLTSTPLLWQREGRHLLRSRCFSRTCDSNVRTVGLRRACVCVGHFVSCRGREQSNVKTQVPLVQRGPVELERQGRRIS